jgi:threonine/homoserine/homoserine lactone efflux protein
MIPIETITIFFAASVALALAPGPDNIFVLTQSALHGRAAGLFVTIGLCTGLLVHTAAVSLGIAGDLPHERQGQHCPSRKYVLPDILDLFQG